MLDLIDQVNMDETPFPQYTHSAKCKGEGVYMQLAALGKAAGEADFGI